MQIPFRVKFSPSFILPLFQPLIRLSRTCSISSGFNRPPLSSLLSSALQCLLRRRRTYVGAAAAAREMFHSPAACNRAPDKAPCRRPGSQNHVSESRSQAARPPPGLKLELE